MDRNDRSSRRRVASTEDVDPSEQSSFDRDVEVVGVYDDLDGSPVFVVESLVADDAWIAVRDGQELAVDDWA